jgi:hypothetical protein
MVDREVASGLDGPFANRRLRVWDRRKSVFDEIGCVAFSFGNTNLCYL